MGPIGCPERSVRNTTTRCSITHRRAQFQQLRLKSRLFWFATENSDWYPFATDLHSCNSRDVRILTRCKWNLRHLGNLRSVEWYRGADKSLARLRRKQANVSARMAWISFGALPCRKKKTWWELASRCCWNRARRLTCFRACFLPGRAKDLSALLYIKVGLV